MRALAETKVIKSWGESNKARAFPDCISWRGLLPYMLCTVWLTSSRKAISFLLQLPGHILSSPHYSSRGLSQLWALHFSRHSRHQQHTQIPLSGRHIRCYKHWRGLARPFSCFFSARDQERPRECREKEGPATPEAEAGRWGELKVIHLLYSTSIFYSYCLLTLPRENIYVAHSSHCCLQRIVV